MSTDQWLDLGQIFVSFLLGAAGLLISWAVFRLSREQARNSWLTTFSEIHSYFWTDETIRNIRLCLAYEKAYKPLKTALQRRRQIYEKKEGQLNESEYQLIDKLDNFINLLQRAVAVSPALKFHGDLWAELFFSFWLKKCFEKDVKPELVWYLETFYPGFSKRVPHLLEKVQKYKWFKNE